MPLSNQRPSPYRLSVRSLIWSIVELKIEFLTWTKRVLAFAVAVIAISGSATAANIKADPLEVAIQLRELGYPAELSSDTGGDPKLDSTAADVVFSIFFYGCIEKKNCDSIQFYAGFDKKDGIDLAKINNWNVSKRYGVAYVDDENDPRIEYDVNLDGEGVSVENFKDTIELWVALLAAFKTHIDW